MSISRLEKEIASCEKKLATMGENDLLRHVYMAVRCELILKLESARENATIA